MLAPTQQYGPWLTIVIIAAQKYGYPLQYRGASTTRGLYFVGLPFLHSFASMLIGGAGRDTERVAEQIAARPRARSFLVWNGAVDAVETSAR